MREDLKDIIAMQPAQHSLDWFRVRIGKFTGSQVGRLMKKGRGKDEIFGKDALSYINEIVAERMLNPAVVAIDAMFEEYLMQVTPSSKAMAWGNDHELEARDLYAKTRNHTVTSCGAVEVAGFYADSPDGLVVDEDGCVEIKCPMNTTHTSYLVNVRTAEDLKDVKPEYYWQCVSHLLATGAQWCDWMSYCPFNAKPLHVVRIERNEDVNILLDRVTAAQGIAGDMMAKIKASGDVS